MQILSAAGYKSLSFINAVCGSSVLDITVISD